MLVLGAFSHVHTIDLTIEDVAFGGKGVARDEGKAVFIPFTIDGERVTAKITREKKQFAEGELIELLEPSAHRAVPECPYFGRCGGCSYQHISYAHQLELKARQVEQAMRRIGKISEPPMRPIIPSPSPYGYRNRITVHAEDNVVGFYRRDVHQLMDIAHCPIAMPEVNAALAQLRARASFAGIEIDAERALAELCSGRTSFAELASAGLLAALRQKSAVVNP